MVSYPGDLVILVLSFHKASHNSQNYPNLGSFFERAAVWTLGRAQSIMLSIDLSMTTKKHLYPWPILTLRQWLGPVTTISIPYTAESMPILHSATFTIPMKSNWPETEYCGTCSVLGLLLFLLYINDITSTCHQGHFILFADDTDIFVQPYRGQP